MIFHAGFVHTKRCASLFSQVSNVTPFCMTLNSNLTIVWQEPYGTVLLFGISCRC